MTQSDRGEGKVENPALRQAQGGDSSTTLTVPEQGRRERSRTTRGGGEGDKGGEVFEEFVACRSGCDPSRRTPGWA